MNVGTDERRINEGATDRYEVGCGGNNFAVGIEFKDKNIHVVKSRVEDFADKNKTAVGGFFYGMKGERSLIGCSKILLPNHLPRRTDFLQEVIIMEKCSVRGFRCNDEISVRGRNKVFERKTR